MKADDHTVYVDNVGTTTVTTEGDAGGLILGKGDPYISDKVADLVSRSYRTSSFVWESTDPLGTILYTLALPEAFFTFPFIKDRLKNYRYFRCRARVSMRMNTTKYQYGSLMVSYIPFYDKDGTYACRHNTVAQAAQNNGMIFSANTGNTLEFDLPFVSPLSWWDTTKVGLPENRGMLGTVFVHVLNPLKSASPSPPPSVEVSVFVQMLDTEVAGLVPLSAPPLLEVEPQLAMPGNVKEAKDKQKSGVLVGVKKAVGTILPVVEDVAQAADSVMGLFSSIGLDKPGTVALANAYYPDPDSDFLYASGVDYSRKLTFSPSAQTAKSPLFFGGSPNPGLYETMRRPYFWRRFEFDSNNVTDDLLFSFIVCPGMYTTTTSGANNILNIGPLAFYSSMFAYYRGGMKVLLHFNTSTFTTTRVRITHVQADTMDAAALANYSGDFTSRVVDITGDTFVSFVVPYLDPKTFMRFDWANVSDTPEDHLGTIGITLVNPVVAPDISVTPTVSCSVFIAAAEDYEVAQFTSVREPLRSTWQAVTGPVLPTAVEATPQTALREQFEKAFEGLTPATLSRQYGLITQDSHMAVTDLGKRYSPWTLGASTTGVLPSIPRNDVTDFFAYPFLFVRGSMRIKWVDPGQAETSASSYLPAAGNIGGTLTYFCGSVWNGSKFGKQVAGAEIPFIQEYPFYEVANTHPEFVESACLAFPSYASATGTLWIAYGDDLSLGYQAALPLFYVPAPAQPARVKRQARQ